MDASEIALYDKHYFQSIVSTETFYHFMFTQSLTVQLLINGKTGQIIDANPAACEFYGYKHSLFCTMNISDLSEIPETALSKTPSELQTNRLGTYPQRHKLASGEKRYVSVPSTTFIVEGTPIIHAIVQDITEHVQAEKALVESEERYRNLVAMLHDGVILQRADGSVVTSNPRAAEILGLEHTRLQNCVPLDSTWQAIHADGTPIPDDMYPARIALRTGEPVTNVTMGIRKPDGSLIWTLTSSQPLFDVPHSNIPVNPPTSNAPALPVAVVTSFTDITALKKAEEALIQTQHALTEERDFAQLVLHTMGEGLLITNPQGQFTYANSAFCAMIGYTETELLGKTTFDLVIPEDHVLLEQHRQSRLQGVSDSYEIRTRRADGTIIYVHISGVPYQRAKEVVGFIVVVTDISERRRAQVLLERQARHDLLTGLPNRRFFRERLEAALIQAKTAGKRLAIGFMDLDGFKQVNDHFGHTAGDLLLQQIAQRLTDCMAHINHQIIARMGGDEFTLILTDIIHTNQVQAYTTQILNALHLPFDLDGQIVEIGASIGFALYPDDGTESSVLLQKADAAMYNAKQAKKIG